MISTRPLVSLASVCVLGCASGSIGAQAQPRPDGSQSAQNNAMAGEITPALDGAIRDGLEYLASTQNPDGSFGGGRYGKNVAITALACLALMADGNMPGRGRYAQEVQLGLEYILNNSAENGLIAAEASNGPMYGHGFSALFLGEVYGMTMGGGDTRTAARTYEALVKAVRLIERTQNDEGGWRYNPVPYDADVSVTICQVMALRSARNAGVRVSKDTIDRAVEYVRRCQNPDGGVQVPGRRRLERLAALRRRRRQPLLRRHLRGRRDRRRARVPDGHGPARRQPAPQAALLLRALLRRPGDVPRRRTRLGPLVARDPRRTHRRPARRRLLGRPERRFRIWDRHGPHHPANAEALSADLPEVTRTPIHLLLSLAFATGASAQTVDRILIDRSLDETRVGLVRIEDGTLTYLTREGLVRVEPTADYLAITTPPRSARETTPTDASDEARRRITAIAAALLGATPGAGRGYVELTDGRRLLGSLVQEEAGDDAVWWEVDGLGVVRVPLEEISRIVFADVRAPEDEPAEDLVDLRNGDRTSGFVASIGERVVIETGGADIDLPLSYVAAIALANPAGTLEGTVAWLSSGAVIRVEGFGPNESGRVELLTSGASYPTEAVHEGDEEAAPARPSVALTDLWAVSFEADRLTPLASVPPADQQPSEGRRWTEPLRMEDPREALLGAPSMTFPGPMSVTWSLPDDAARFATSASLPPAMRLWGDCELVVSITTSEGDAELFRARLHDDEPVAIVNVVLPGRAEQRRELTITVEPGAYGPIQDRVVFERPLLLMGAD